MQDNKEDVAILKTLWGREPDGRWGITGMKGLDLKPGADDEPSFFRIQGQMELLTNRPRGSFHEILSSFGPTDNLLKQSILPVVSLVSGERTIRCIGTASVISCTGYLLTASHVLLDPVESGYGKVTREGSTLLFDDSLRMGVLIPLPVGYTQSAFRFFPFQRCWHWGKWKESPLIHEKDQFQHLTDIAICKIEEMPNSAAHQPLSMSLNAFKPGERAFAFGYALVDDIPFEVRDGRMILARSSQDLYVSVGEVMTVFPTNHVTKDVPTPGPCFDFRARIPGKMSGGPILGGDGTVVRGVVSRSFSGESHAYGSMLGPMMHIPLSGASTLKVLMESGNEGMARMQGVGL